MLGLLIWWGLILFVVVMLIIFNASLEAIIGSGLILLSVSVIVAAITIKH